MACSPDAMIDHSPGLATTATTGRVRGMIRTGILAAYGRHAATETTQMELEANEEETRDWAELPRDPLLAVLHRLHHADVLIGAITRLPMLEELSVWCGASATTASGGHYKLVEICAAAAKACPLLKRLRLSKYLFHRLSDAGDREAIMEIAKMRGLRCLQLFGNSLSNAGLEAILGGCVCLESLDIRRCFSVKMNHEMRAMSARLQRLRLPDDTMDGYDLGFGNGSPETQGVRFHER